MAQFARPDSDISDGLWSPIGGPSDLFDCLNESSPNDSTDYIESLNGDNTTCEVGLSNITDPAGNIDHVIRFRMQGTGSGGPERCKVELWDGGTLIADTGNETSRGAWNTKIYTLTDVEADNIGDYTNLRFKIISSNLGGTEDMWVTWAEFEIPDAGSTQFDQSVSGAVTPTGAITKLIDKIGFISGSLAPSGIVAKETLKQFAGSLTPSGIAAGIKLVFKTISGALTPTGALARITLKSVAGSLTPVGTLAKDTFISLVGFLTPIGTLVKETLKRLVGSLTPSGLAAGVKTALITITGSLTPVGTLVKETGKSVAGALTPSGTLVKSILKELQGSLTPTGGLTKLTFIIMAGNLTPSGILAAATLFGQLVAGVLAPIGTLATTFIPGSGGVTRIYRRLLTVIDGLRHRRK